MRTRSEDLERCRRAYVEATIVDVLVKNFSRLSRYPDAVMARPAIENVAREMRARLDEPLVS